MEFIEKHPPSFTPTNQAVPLPILIPQTSENSFFYQNGLSKIIPRLTLKVHSDLEQCQMLWDVFSPKKSLFDDWNFRLAWHTAYASVPYFYTLYEGKTPIALLPIAYDIIKKRYEWFGTYWMEDNTFFVKEEHYTDLLYAVTPVPIHLNAIEKTANQTLFDKDITLEDPKNIKDISTFRTMDDLLLTYKKKYRHHLKADYLYVQSLNPRTVITDKPDEKLMDKMIAMNIAQFSDRPDDESDLVVPQRVAAYKNMLLNSKKYTVKFIEIYIQDRLAGIDFILCYKDRYYTMKGGIDVNRFKGISNYMVYYEFEDAIKSNYNLVDCLQVDYGWKHHFFDQTPTYLFEK